MSDQIGNAVQHHTETIRGHRMHWVTAGSEGSPILLVHGFPETWWTFHRLIPLLAERHRVVAVDLPGFGDSTPAEGATTDDLSSAAAAEVLHELIERLGMGPVHLSGQDVPGDAVFRLAVTHPGDVRSLIATEMVLAGYGLESLADVAHGGAWHVGAIATPGVAEFVFGGRERRFLEEMWFPAMTRVEGAVTPEDLDRFTDAYSRPGAWRGPQGLYAAGLREGDEIRALAETHAFRGPVLAIDAMSAPFTAATMTAVSPSVKVAVIEGVGHHPALEAPERMATLMLDFIERIDGDQHGER